MFIKVKIDNLIDFTKSIPPKLNNETNVNKDKIKIVIVKKYLFI